MTLLICEVTTTGTYDIACFRGYNNRNVGRCSFERLQQQERIRLQQKEHTTLLV